MTTKKHDAYTKTSQERSELIIRSMQLHSDFEFLLDNEIPSQVDDNLPNDGSDRRMG